MSPKRTPGYPAQGTVSQLRHEETRIADTADHHSAPPPFQATSDAIIARVFFWAIPRRVRPNHLTMIRFALLVPLVWLLLTEHRRLALVVFVVGAITDFLDGAMARRRDQITNVGIVIDPIADKLLIGLTLGLLGWQYLVIKVIVVALAIELMGVALGTLLWLRGPRRPLPGANVFGKIKMVLQSIGGALFLLGASFDVQAMVDVALVLLWAALAFAALSVVRFGHLARTSPPR